MAPANSEASTQTKAIGSQSPIDGEPAVNNGWLVCWTLLCFHLCILLLTELQFPSGELSPLLLQPMCFGGSPINL